MSCQCLGFGRCSFVGNTTLNLLEGLGWKFHRCDGDACLCAGFKVGRDPDRNMSKWLDRQRSRAAAALDAAALASAAAEREGRR